MVAIEASEVRPGLVVHLNTEVLRERGGCTTNAAVFNGNDRAVHGPHYFLVLRVDGDHCTAAPLFSDWALGSDLLEESLKTGLPDKWTGQPSYTSRWQQWKIPLESVEAASGDEESAARNRRLYATHNPTVLERILSWEKKNKYEYRQI